jgi:thiol-disulfide isomerase/thioredoxin
VTQGVVVLVVVLVVASAFGLWRAAVDGRFRGTRRIHGVSHEASDDEPAPGILSGTDLEHRLGERATLVQFSSAFCAPCRATRRVLGEVASAVPGVEHVEVDAEQHLDLVRRLGILRTPTTLVLAADGHEVVRAAGLPTKADVLSAVSAAIES